MPDPQTIKVDVPIEFDSTLVVSCTVPSTLPVDRLKKAGRDALPRTQVEAVLKGKIDLPEKEVCARAIGIVNKERESRPVIEGIAKSFTVNASKLESYRGLGEETKNQMSKSLLEHKDSLLARQTKANFTLLLSPEFAFIRQCIGEKGLQQFIKYSRGKTEHLKINLNALDKIFHELASNTGFGKFPSALKTSIYTSFSPSTCSPLKADLKPTEVLWYGKSLQDRFNSVLAVKDKEGKTFHDFDDAIKLGLGEKFFEQEGLYDIFKATLKGSATTPPEIFDFQYLNPKGLSAEAISFALSKTLEYSRDGKKPLKQVVERYNILLHAPESVTMRLYSKFGLEPGKTPLPGNNPTKVSAMDFAAAVVASRDIASMSEKDVEALGNRIRTVNFIADESRLTKRKEFDLLLRSVQQYSDGVFNEGSQKLNWWARLSLLKQILNAPIKFNPESFHPNLLVSFPEIKRDNYTHSKHHNERISFDSQTPKKLTDARSWRMEFDSHSIKMTKPLVDHPKMEEWMISITERTLAGLPTQLRKQVKEVRFMPELDPEQASMRAGNGVIYIYPLDSPRDNKDVVSSIYHEYGHILAIGSAVTFTKADREEWKKATKIDPASVSQYGREGFRKAIYKEESKIDEDIAEFTSIYLPARFGTSVDAEKTLSVIGVLYPNRAKLLEKKIYNLLNIR